MPVTDGKGKPYTARKLRRLFNGLKKSNPEFAAQMAQFTEKQQEGIFRIVVFLIMNCDSMDDVLEAFNNWVDAQAKQK